MRGAVTFLLGDASEAVLLLLRAVLAFEPLDVRVARNTMLAALQFAFWARPAVLHEAALAAQALAHVPEPRTTAMDLLVDGLAALFLGDCGAAAPLPPASRCGISGR